MDTANDFAVSQAIPFPGEISLRGERAIAEAESAQSDVEVERVKLAALASRLFDEYWLAERALETNARHAVLLDEVHRVALSRYAAGTGSQQDVLAAETEQGMLAHRERSSRPSAASTASASICCFIAPRSASSRRHRRIWGLRSRARSTSNRWSRVLSMRIRAAPTRGERSRPRGRSHWRAASSFPTSRCAVEYKIFVAGRADSSRSSAWS